MFLDVTFKGWKVSVVAMKILVFVNLLAANLPVIHLNYVWISFVCWFLVYVCVSRSPSPNGSASPAIRHQRSRSRTRSPPRRSRSGYICDIRVFLVILTFVWDSFMADIEMEKKKHIFEAEQGIYGLVYAI